MGDIAPYRGQNVWVSRDARTAARLRAYRLMEALQGADRDGALTELAELEALASDPAWPEVVFLARLGQAMDGVLYSGDPQRTLHHLDELVAWAEELGPPALLAHALGLRAIVRATCGDTELVIADAARGLALLDRADLPALDACTALVVCAAAYNALSLWELVDAIYDRASALEPMCEEPIQAAAIAMNRIVIRLEWASSLLEEGHADQARQVLARAAAAVRAADALEALPELWRTGVYAARASLQIFLNPPEDPADLVAHLRELIDALRRGEDTEMLPLTETYAALGLLELGRSAEALPWLGTDTIESASSGARSFRLWVRAQALRANAPDSAAALAFQDYGQLLAGQRRDARRAVLAAAQSRIADETTRAERDRLAIDVVLDPLTGLANRRAFDRWLGRDRAEARLTAVILVDLDNFKAMNDQHGHAVGDEVLRQIGAILGRHVRPGDLAIRVGGDEFALVLEAQPPDHAPSEAAFTAIALSRAGDLRDAIDRGDWPEVRSGLRFSASTGVAVRLLEAHDPSAASELYRAADLALYASKVPRQRTEAGTARS
jgi:diguanylate cyclase (GGDEF)-like protein